MKKIREIIRIYAKNPDFSHRQIQRALGVSRPVVTQTITDFKQSGLSCEDISGMDDNTLSELLQSHKKQKSKRYETLSAQFEYFATELKRTGVTLELLWNEYKRDNPDGYSRTQFCHHFQVWRQNSKLSMHMDYKAGDKMFIDFAGKKLHITDRETGIEKPVEVFVAILGCSQYTYVEAVESQKKEDFIHCTENAFIHFGGVTQAIVPDCLKSAVTRADKYDPDINPEYNNFANHYDTTIFPARALKPKDKAHVENAVKITYSWIYAPLRNMTFYSLIDLNRSIRALLVEYNSKQMQKLKISRLQLFIKLEKDELQPLPDQNYEFKKIIMKTVPPNYHVELTEDRHYYSVPYHYRGKKVEIWYSQKNVEIYHKHRRIAFHLRDRAENRYTTSQEHIHHDHKWEGEWNANSFIEKGQKLGEHVKLLIERVLKSIKYPDKGYRICSGILNLNKDYNTTRLDKACKKALSMDCCSLKRVKNILENHLEDYEEEDLFSGLPEHENIRGNQYYN